MRIPPFCYSIASVPPRILRYGAELFNEGLAPSFKVARVGEANLPFSRGLYSLLNGKMSPALEVGDILPKLYSFPFFCLFGTNFPFVAQTFSEHMLAHSGFKHGTDSEKLKFSYRTLVSLWRSGNYKLAESDTPRQIMQKVHSRMPDASLSDLTEIFELIEYGNTDIDKRRAKKALVTMGKIIRRFDD